MKLAGKKVLVLGDLDYVDLFESEGANVYNIDPHDFLSDHPDINDYISQADLVCLTGGEDVNPLSFGYIQDPKCGPTSPSRDAFELHVARTALSLKIPIVGICRGAQFLCYLNGGTCVQHMTGHHGDHTAYSDDGAKILLVSSDHHQMMVPTPDAEILLYARESNPVEICPGHLAFGTTDDAGDQIDPEVVYWPNTKTLGHQPHPEWMSSHSQYYQYFFYTVKKLMES